MDKHKLKIENKSFGILMITFIAVLVSAYPLYHEIYQLENQIKKSEALLFTKNDTRISSNDGRYVHSDSLPEAREHCPKDKARAIGSEDGWTDRSVLPRVYEKFELVQVSHPILSEASSSSHKENCPDFENKNELTDHSNTLSMGETSELSAAPPHPYTDEGEANYEIFYPKNLPDKRLPDERMPREEIPNSPWPENRPPVETMPKNPIPSNPLPSNRQPVQTMPKGRTPNNRLPSNPIPSNRIPSQ